MGIKRARSASVNPSIIMQRATVVFFLVAAVSAFPDHHRHTRMIGGEAAKPGALPFVVSFRRESKNLPLNSCLGSIIDAHWILSSALCTQHEEVKNVIIYPNQYEHKSNPTGPHYHPDQIIIHPDFDGKTGKNDIALIHLPRPLTFSDTVKPIKIGKNGKGSKVKAVGWNEDPSTGLGQGKPEVYHLGTLPLTITKIEDCQEEFPDLHSIVNLGEEQICTYPGKGNDLCGVDAGAPLVDESTGDQVGIANDVIFVASGHNHQCHPEHNHPLLFTKLDYYRSWINDVTKLKL